MAETISHKKHVHILRYDEGPWAQLQTFQGFFDGWVAKDPRHNTRKKFGQMLDVSGDTIRRLYEGKAGDRDVRPCQDAILQIAGIFGVAPTQLGWVDDGRVTLPDAEAQAPDQMPLGVDLEDQTIQAPVHPATLFYYVPVTEFGNWGKKIVESLHPWWAENIQHVPVMLTEGVRDPHVTTVELPAGLPKFARMQMSTAMVQGILKGRRPESAMEAMRQIVSLHLAFETAMSPAQPAVAGQQDLLGPFRGAVQGLLQLNDELKILVVDSEDVAEGSKDPRTSMIAKRLKTLRKTNQDLLTKLNGK